MNSKSDKYKNIFYPSECISDEQLIRYHKKILSKKEMHEVERHLLDCPLCADAIEGLACGDQETSIREIKDKVRSLTSPEKNNFNYKLIAIAALLVVSLGISFLIYQKTTDSKMPENLVLNSESNQLPENKITGFNEDSAVSEISKIADTIVKVKKQIETPPNNLIAAIPEKKKEMLSKKEDKISDIPPQEKSEIFNTVQNNQTIGNSIKESNNIEESSAIVDTFSKFAYTPTDEPENLSETTIAPESETSEKLDLGKTYFSAPSKARNKSIEPNSASDESSELNKNFREIASAEITTSESDNLFSTAMDKYNRKEYKEAVEIFNKILQNKPKDEEVIYYTALSYYYIKDFKLAIILFENSVENSKSSFFETGQWYLALSYVENKEINKAKKLLKLIVDQQGKYELEAQQQLEKMK